MPDWAPHVRARLALLRLSPARENEIVEELSQHLDDRWRELVSAGASEHEAVRLALADFREGNVLAKGMAPLRQAHTPTPITLGAAGRSLPGSLWRDFRYATRMLRKHPGTAGTVILTLALAIGATTAIFAVVDALLLRSLPFPEADRLVQIVRAYPGGFGTAASIPKFVRWRSEGKQVFVELAAYSALGSGFTLIGSAPPERLIGSYVSSGFFAVMGVQASLGRVFGEGEDLPGRPKVVVLSHALWQTRFGGSADVIGQAITLNSEPYTVIGVTPKGFRYPDDAQLWTLLQLDLASQERAHRFMVIARLKPDSTLDQGRTAMQIAAGNIRRERPELMEENESIDIRPLRDTLYGSMRQPLLILLVSVGFVLLIACVNVANLRLAQNGSRQQEIAVRTALGASWTVIVRQLLTESVLLAAIGGLAGVTIAYLGVTALLAWSPVEVPYAERITVDRRVLAFALVTSLGTSVAFGLLPAWLSARPNLDEVLRAGAHRLARNSSRWVRRALVVGEVALALMLTIGAFLLIKSLVGLQSIAPGFAVEHLLTMKLALPESRYGSAEALARFQEEIEQRLTQVPGVRAAGLAHTLPLQSGADLPFTIEGRYVAGTQTGVGDAHFRPVGRVYFEALQIPLRRGRGFDARDRRGTLNVAIVNETAALKYWPNENPIGQRITVGQPFVPDLADPGPREIVGVVGDVREQSLGASPPPILYVPISQLNDGYAALGSRLLPFSVAVRGEMAVANLTRPVQEAIWSIDPQQPITDVRLMEDIVAGSLGSQRFNAILLGALATLAMVLAAVGLYGLIAHLVIHQRQEIGIRMALGASKANVFTLFLRQILVLVAVGVALGLVGALGLTRVLQTLLTGISTTDPWVFAVGPALMFGVAVLAALRPALGAAAVDPTGALRAE